MASLVKNGSIQKDCSKISWSINRLQFTNKSYILKFEEDIPDFKNLKYLKLLYTFQNAEQNNCFSKRFTKCSSRIFKGKRWKIINFPPFPFENPIEPTEIAFENRYSFGSKKMYSNLEISYSLIFKKLYQKQICDNYSIFPPPVAFFYPISPKMLF